MTATLALVPDPLLPPFRAPYAPDDADLVRALIAETGFAPEADARIDAEASRLIAAIRAETGSLGVEEFLREFALSTREGLALMVLAEALLRVPDAATADKLIEDKLNEAQFENHERVSEAWLVSASAWAMGVTAKVLRPGDTPMGILGGTIRRLGRPTVRTAALQAMKVMGHQFVLGQTIAAAIDRARAKAAKGYRHSYDMLGEGARTRADAEAHYASYLAALTAIGKAAGAKGALPQRPGMSVKLSAIHPRYEATNAEAVLADLVPKMIELGRIAKDYDLNLTIDAEEADRLELSLDVFAASLADPSLKGWNGYGLAIQAYQKRARQVVDWVGAAAESLDRRLMVRLVKGAYWDSEIKRAQERGLADYPLFTRKAATDLSYLACARRLMALRPRIYPQFATHNALTVAFVRELGREGWSDPANPGYEFQKLHGMGDALYAPVVEADGIPCRIYAPAGHHRDLLAYLVRRLLENGANSSFVATVGDLDVPVETLLTRPAAGLGEGARARHGHLPLPRDLYGARRNSRGWELGCAEQRDALETAVAGHFADRPAAAPLIDGVAQPGAARPVVSPIDGRTVAGEVVEADAALAARAMLAAAAGFPAWEATPATTRAAALDRWGDALEAEAERLIALLAVESGKTRGDAIAEVREAVDFCRYYATETRRQFAEPKRLPGPTGEDNRLAHRGRGVFVCISPWNFPLAIFTGQVAAALAAGNAVVAKPAGATPLVACEAVRLAHAAGVAKSALQFVPGPVGAALAADAAVAGVAFTGSTETAWGINRALAAKTGPIVPLIAETGGLNAMIVDATALPEQVADDVVASAFRSAGQRCSALRLLFVQEDVAEGMIAMIAGAAKELKVGDPRDLASDVGAVIDAAARDAIRAHVDAMRAQGKVIFEGETPAEGSWIAPTIVRLDDPGELTREIFGPVLHVVTWKAKDLDKVLAAVAATGYGLTLGVHSRIEATVRRVVERLRVGNVYVNRNIIGAVVGVQPFGGSGLSGTGPKAGGPGYLARFAVEQTVSVNTAAAGGNASLIAMGED